MKIILSHDVDHLFTAEHWTKDLILPKLAARSALQWLGVYSEKISFREMTGRIGSVFAREMNHLDALSRFDKEHGVPSTFFFGMNQGLGMSYLPPAALPYIRMLRDRGFATGVHGICFDDQDGILREKAAYQSLTGQEPAGIRMHYVRFDGQTFDRLARAGYAFDSTEFDKKTGCCVKAPWRGGGMWEFPLTVMDTYLPYALEGAKARTLELLARAEAEKIGYATILFHDFMYQKAWAQTRDWYEWLIGHCGERYEFCSFAQAVEELNA